MFLRRFSEQLLNKFVDSPPVESDTALPNPEDVATPRKRTFSEMTITDNTVVMPTGSSRSPRRRKTATGKSRPSLKTEPRSPSPIRVAPAVLVVKREQTPQTPTRSSPRKRPSSIVFPGAESRAEGSKAIPAPNFGSGNGLLPPRVASSSSNVSTAKRPTMPRPRSAIPSSQSPSPLKSPAAESVRKQLSRILDGPEPGDVLPTAPNSPMKASRSASAQESARSESVDSSSGARRKVRPASRHKVSLPIFQRTQTKY